MDTSLPKICLVLLYFGKLPPYWGGFIDSCKDNAKIDFLIVTDCLRSSYDFAPNVKIVYKTWREVQDLIIEKFGECGYSKVCISYPYKLCDYKPTYGYLLQEYLEGYDYWGYIDCDLVFGDLENFFLEAEIERYDRIYNAGHLSVYRNTDEINTLFMKCPAGLPSFKDVAGTSFIRNYDERGINGYFDYYKLRFNKQGRDATFGIYTYEYRWQNQSNPSLGEIFVKQSDGRTVVYIERPDKSVEVREVSYIHFMTKKDISIPFGQKRPYYISRQGINEFTPPYQIAIYR